MRDAGGLKPSGYEHCLRRRTNFISALTFGRLIVAFDNDLPADELEQWTDAGMVMLGALFFAD